MPTSGGHPQTDGLVERLNRTLKVMLSKLVERNGKNWDEFLDPVLVSCQTTPHASTGHGESPFFLLYGRDARIPSVLDFYSQRLKLLTLESEYGRELFCELKKIRELAKLKISRAQYSQKSQYDKGSKESKIREGDLVTLKVDPMFKLDRTFRGPYRVHGVTSTSARIQPINNPNADVICVSLQVCLIVQVSVWI